jgi:hypothetical protein
VLQDEPLVSALLTEAADSSFSRLLLPQLLQTSGSLCAPMLVKISDITPQPEHLYS